MTFRGLIALLAVAAVGLMAPSASAQEKKADRKEAKEDRKEVNEAKKDVQEAKKDAKHAGDKAADAGAEAVDKAKGKLAAARAKLKESREERRTSARAALRAKYGKDLLEKPAVRAELRLHAQRMAKLRQMKDVADDADKKQLEERVDKMIDKENKRHDARMDALKAKNGEDTK